MPLFVLSMTDSIQAIIGLGNPGAKYALTRHNAGFWFVDALAQAHSAALKMDSSFQAEVGKLRLAGAGPGADCWLLKPQQFMNQSGRAVQALLGYYGLQPENLLVVHDELDLMPGVIRLKKGGGHGGHNGLRDIISALGGNAGFWRLRLGIGHPGAREEVINYVLGRASKVDSDLILAAIGRAFEYLPQLCKGEQQRVMNALHQT